MATLRMLTSIVAPPERCFDLSRSIDLHVESMIASHERAVAGVTSGLICLGEDVSWEARHFGLLWRMTSRITHFDPPRRFVDEMVRGPFTRFRHVHDLAPQGAVTLMTDVVDFDLPLGRLTNAAAGLYLQRLLTIRNALIRSEVERG